MATYTRKNAWNNNGTFDNLDLLWYATGVGEMQKKALDDPKSWWFFAAIHGEYVTPENLRDPQAPAWKKIQAPPTVPTTPLPPVNTSDLYWDQCQHQSWFFLPWHRGYLLALEAQVRAIIIQLGGPATWALPYWDYFGQDPQFNIPPAFSQKNLPNGSRNPLYVEARFGPDLSNVVYVTTAEGIKQHPNDPVKIPGLGTVTLDSMTESQYTGGANAIPPGFGGPATGFSNQGDTNGGLESNPHNLVHVSVGGYFRNGPVGLMSDPGLAALDPIFYLHHANIDRLWAGWNQEYSNPTDLHWLNGPTAQGDRKFVLPMPDGSSWQYTPNDMKSLAQQNYAYEQLPDVPAAGDLFAQRLTKLGAAKTLVKTATGATMSNDRKVELVGVSQTDLAIKGSVANASIALDPSARRKVSASLEAAPIDARPDRVFLKLENIRGTQDATVLSVYLNLPEGEKPAEHAELLAGSVGLFGLRRASWKEGRHGGQGLSFVLEITRIVDALHLNNALNSDSLRVTVVPNRLIPAAEEIIIGRVSIYREGV